jgi:hypothetical protein
VRWLPGKPGRSHASLDARAPLRRSDELVIEALGDELLVYDRTNKRAHCLSADAARVWRACDGKSGAGKMSADLGLRLDVVRQAVDELEASGLLDQGLELVTVDPGNGNGKAVTRRELAVRSARVGTLAATAPLILSIAAPTPAAAATVIFAECGKLTGNSCGNATNQCGSFLDCCCCCGFGSNPGSCQTCTPLGQCPKTGNCTVSDFNGVGTRANCQSGNVGGATPPANGCCGATISNCGCLWSPTGTGGDGISTGPGCCIPGANPPTTSVTCANPGAANCVPCCQGLPINLTTARPGCCGTTNTCT